MQGDLHEDRLLTVTGVTIGGATVSLSGAAGRGSWTVDRLHRPFLSLDGSPALALSVLPLSALRQTEGTLRFDSGSAWRILETPDSFLWRLRELPRRGSASPARALSVDRAWRSGTLYLTRPRSGATAQRFPLDYPLEQLLFVSLLARPGAAVVHGAGLILDGRGLVFAGTHGAGKSTLAALLRGRRGVRLLNDDRVVVRRVRGDWRLFGTPWAGTVRLASPESAPLAGVFFLRHGLTTRALPLSASEAIPRLLARCFHPYWDRQGLEALLGSVGRLANDIPCYDFRFVPELAQVVSALHTLK